MTGVNRSYTSIEARSGPIWTLKTCLVQFMLRGWFRYWFLANLEAYYKAWRGGGSDSESIAVTAGILSLGGERIGDSWPRNHGLAEALTMFASSGRKHLLDEHIRAEIAGRYILRTSDPHRKCSKRTLASEYGVCEKTIRNIRKEFENEQKIVKAITAAEQYNRRNLGLTHMEQAVLPWRT